MVYKTKLCDFAKELSLEKLYVPDDFEKRDIIRSDVSRPGLPLAGFFQDFEPQRIQIIGNMEHSYLRSLSHARRYSALDTFLSKQVIAVVVTSGLECFGELVELARKYNTPLLRTNDNTSPFMAAAIGSLSVLLAERIVTHGVFVEVYGEGILMLGDSGIGKSETAIELVKRGHRLIADDAVEIKRVSNKTLVGTAPDLIRYYIELRGIGIVDVRRLFGMGAVKATERIDLVIKLENWEPGKAYDRFGLDEEVENILGIGIPAITIPVHHGRNLAVVLEIAAMNNRQKKMGYNTAEEFNQRLMEQIESEEI